MKIMFCLGSMTKGGAERVVRNLSEYLIKENDVSIVVTPPGESSYKLNNNVKYFTLDKEKNKNQNLIVRTIRRIYNLRRIINKLSPDIIISMLPEPTYRLVIANLFKKNKVIISVRNDPKIEYNTFAKRLIMNLLYSRANGFVFQTEEAKNYFRKSFKVKSKIIPNPIDETFISKPYKGTRKKEIVSVGRLDEQKNQMLLIDSFSKIDKKYNDYKLIIYGEGILKEKLENQIKKLKLKDRIILAGNVNDVKSKIYKSKLFVLSSYYEGMPNALMEAMALGLTCISTDCPCGGPSFLIKDGYNGFLTKVGDEQDLIETINYALSIDTMTIEENASKIATTLNPNKINKQWSDYIEYILKRK